MENSVREAALAAARIYQQGKRERTLKQCIAIGAKEHQVPWENVAHYLSGVGARAMLASSSGTDETDAVNQAVRALAPIADLDDEVGGMCSPDSSCPRGWLRFGMIWDCVDALEALEALGYDGEEATE